MPTRRFKQILADNNLPLATGHALFLRVHCGLAASAARRRNRNHIVGVREELTGVWQRILGVRPGQHTYKDLRRRPPPTSGLHKSSEVALRKTMNFINENVTSALQ